MDSKLYQYLKSKDNAANLSQEEIIELAKMKEMDSIQDSEMDGNKIPREIYFPGPASKMQEPEMSPREKNYREALEAVKKKRAEEASLKQLVTNSINAPKMLSREPNSQSYDSELEDLASVVATPYRPSPDVERRVTNIREKDPIKFRKLEELIRTKLDQKK